MTTRAQRWLEERAMLAARRPALQLNRLDLKALEVRGRYKAAISGTHLFPSISPPRITIGGVDLEEVEFRPDGRSVRGVLARAPRDHNVLVDYGFIRAELRK